MGGVCLEHWCSAAAACTDVVDYALMFVASHAKDAFL